MLVSECVKTAILGAVPPWVPLPGVGLLLVTLTGADADVCVPRRRASEKARRAAKKVAASAASVQWTPGHSHSPGLHSRSTA